MMVQSRLLFLAALHSLVPCGLAQADQQHVLREPNHSKNPFTDDFAAFARSVLEQWKVPGTSIAVVDGEEVYADLIESSQSVKAYGYSTLPDTPATTDTLWYGGSTTKAFTAATLAKLIASGEYPALARGWSTPISSIIRDDFVLRDTWATEHIALDDAVSHRTGMPRHDFSLSHKIDGRTATVKDAVRNLRNLDLTAEPRTRFMYCNLMFLALSHVLETIRNEWLGDIFKVEIWDPLKMNGTYLDLDEAKKAPQPLASGYVWNRNTGEHELVPELPVEEISGAGAIFSNVLDYAKWLKCLMHQCDVFTSAVHQDIRTPRMIGGFPQEPFDVQLYGLGWIRTLYKGHVMYQHGGGTHAFTTSVWWFPDLKYAIVSFANTATTASAVEDTLHWELLYDKLGTPEDDRLDFGSIWQQRFVESEQQLQNAMNLTFPDRPEQPLPPTLETNKLIGDYYNPGYQGFTLEEEPHPDNPDEKILVTRRPDMTWKYTMSMHHASGDDWLIYATFFGNENNLLTAFFGGEFKIGVDGKVASLEIRMENNYGTTEGAGIVSFKKV